MKLLTLLLLTILFQASLAAKSVKRKKNELREIFCDGTPISDFLFYEIADVETYKAENESPTNKTQRRKDRPKSKSRSPVERALLRALVKYERGNDEMKASIEQLTQDLVEFILPNREAAKDDRSVAGWQPNGDVEAWFDSRETAIKRKLDRFVALKRELLEDFKSYRKGKKLRTAADKVIAKKEVSSVESLPYVTLNGGVCYAKGSTTFNGNLRMCAVCYYVVDFGDNVVPRYASSIECASDTCLLNEGQCSQNVLAYNLEYLDTTLNKWTIFPQPLNTSCSCDCLPESFMAPYFFSDGN